MHKIALLYDTSQAMLSKLDGDEVLQQILAVARDYFHLNNMAILLMDEETQELCVRTELGWDSSICSVPSMAGKGLAMVAATQKVPVYAPDVTKDPRCSVTQKTIRSQLAIPLVAHDKVLGVLDCQSKEVDHFNDETIDLLTLFSVQASMALQNARLYSAERQRTAQLEVINAIAQQTTAVMELNVLLDRVCGLIQESLHVDHVCVLLKEEDELILKAHQGKLTPRFVVGERLPTSDAVLGHACGGKDGKDLRVEDDLDLHTGKKRILKEERSRACVPIVSFGQDLGLLLLASSAPGKFRAADLKPLHSIADICATAIKNAHYVERVKQLAYVDGLTGIFNRRYFEMRILEEIERAARFEHPLALLMADIDHFKRLNDEFGHLLGDEVLRQVSSVLSQHSRKHDIVCRYGGEEFAVVLPEIGHEQALAAAERLRSIIAGWQFPGVPRTVTVSIGVAALRRGAMTRDDLVQAADTALYAAKAAGKNRVVGVPQGKSAAQGAGS
jgi:diguanylate cyclase (GGDEF)-like protein